MVQRGKKNLFVIMTIDYLIVYVLPRDVVRLVSGRRYMACGRKNLPILPYLKQYLNQLRAYLCA